jgi:hypothetical protein
MRRGAAAAVTVAGVTAGALGTGATITSDTADAGNGSGRGGITAFTGCDVGATTGRDASAGGNCSGFATDNRAGDVITGAGTTRDDGATLGAGSGGRIS